MKRLPRGKRRDAVGFLSCYRQACEEVGGKDWQRNAKAVFAHVREQVKPILTGQDTLFDGEDFDFFANEAEKVLTNESEFYLLKCLAYDHRAYNHRKQ